MDSQFFYGYSIPQSMPLASQFKSPLLLWLLIPSLALQLLYKLTLSRSRRRSMLEKSCQSIRDGTCGEEASASIHTLLEATFHRFHCHVLLQGRSICLWYCPKISKEGTCMLPMRSRKPMNMVSSSTIVFWTACRPSSFCAMLFSGHLFLILLKNTLEYVAKQ